MSRPVKYRKICCLPAIKGLQPLNATTKQDIILTIDEYETIRLIDFEGCTQEICALQMNVARTTVQKIYEEARHKLADVLVNGKCLVIKGGQYHMCDGNNSNCIRESCCHLSK